MISPKSLFNGIENLPIQEGESHRCECCNKQAYGCVWQGSYWICLACKTKVDERLASTTKTKPVVVDENELKGLRADGLLSLRTYIYLALRIDGVTETLKAVDIKKFCKRWQIQQEDFISAIASLSKKNVIQLNVSNISAQAFTRKERLQHLESAVLTKVKDEDE